MNCKLIERKRVLSGRALFFIYFINLICSVASYAGGGPSQPEATGFKPIGVSQNVNHFTGDFTYSIPLMDVGGFPLALNYSGTSTNDDEATWTGLGWNLNIGTINRQLRGIPDEFNGKDEVVKMQNIKDNVTGGLNLGATLQFFNYEGLKRKLGLGLSLGIFYNNYTGWGNELGVSPTFSLVNSASTKLTAGLSFKSSTESGMTVTPSLSLSETIDEKDKEQTSLGLSVGAPINSREGMKNISFNASYTNSVNTSIKTLTSKEGKTRNVQNSNSTSFASSSSISFASPSFNPTISMPMYNNMWALSIKGDAHFFGVDVGASAMGHMSIHALRDHIVKRPLYGYLYSEIGKDDQNAVLDFNREKDMAYNENVPTIAVPNMTYDLFVVNQPEVSQQFRAYRTSSGVVFDPYAENKTTSASLGGEIGAGNLFQGGVTINASHGGTETKKWTSNNNFLAYGDFKLSDKNSNPVAEDYYFKANGEMTPTNIDLFSKIAESKPVNVALIGDFENSKASRQFRDNNNNIQVINSFGISSVASGNEKTNHRVSMFSFLTKKERKNFGIERTIKTYNQLSDSTGETPVFGCNNFLTYENKNSKDHHISEITITNPDGRRCIYGIPAYNNFQKEVTFAISSSDINTNGFVKYEPQDASLANSKGTDHYFNSETTPAYPHAWLLTSILSPDYQDVTGDGVSDDDLGSAFKFNYSLKNDKYKWRMPTTGETNRANYNQGLQTISDDDKATYVYGEREEWYLHSIESKTQIALFYLIKRNDALGQSEHDGNDLNSCKYKLDKIVLYSKSDLIKNGILKATPIKSVFFKYSYRLCKNVKNQINSGQGKLTLDSLYFTYGKNNRGSLNSYKFEYQYNPDYKSKNADRWANYKNEGQNVNGMKTQEFPYTKQFDKAGVDLNASAWLISKIMLPSGGEINVNYEADDYSYVQNKRAAYMQVIKGFGKSKDGEILNSLYGDGENDYLFFNFPDGISPKSDAEVRKMFFDDPNNLDMISKLYFRAKVSLIPGKDFEYVPGYADIESCGRRDATTGWIKLYRSENYQPIAYSSWQLLKTQMPTLAYPWSKIGDELGPLSFILSIAGFIGNLTEMFTGYGTLAKEYGYGNIVDVQKSYIRLLKPNYSKHGGGSRVSKIFVNDKWSTLASPDYKDGIYGQEYDYSTIKDGISISSGVAEYEPLLGGDENPFRKPINYEGPKGVFAPSSKYYVEEPICEGFFPSPSVGYSKIKVRSIATKSSSLFGTGWKEYEYYTAKDFPTKTDLTYLGGANIKRFSPDFFSSFLKIDNRTGLYLSQGYTVETNDMHGKAKSEKNFNQEGSLISESKSYYLVEDENMPTASVVNNIPTVNENGSIQKNRLMGVNFDFYTDMRHQSTEIAQIDLELGGGLFLIPFFIPIPVPHISPFLPIGIMENNFYSSSTMKYINRKGILVKNYKMQDGSKVVTENELWDDNTGEVVLTKVSNEYNEPIYNINYPAYWKYKEMGFAFKNSGLDFKGVKVSIGNIAPTRMNPYLKAGDEIGFVSGNRVDKYWVVDDPVSRQLFMIDRAGNFISDSGDFKVVRSGNKNMIPPSMFSASMMVSPLATNPPFYLSSANKILNASGVLYSDQWKIIKNQGVTSDANCINFPKEKLIMIDYSEKIFNDVQNKNTILNWLNCPNINTPQ